MDPELLKEKFVGCMLGTAVGDALGMPVEGWSASSIEIRLGEVRDMMEARLGAGTYTDDTQMMIAMGESLIRNKGFDGEDMARSFLDNYSPDRGYGAGTVQALRLLERGYSWDEAGQKVFGAGSFGNGSAMRVAPIGALYYDDPKLLRRVCYESSMITHAHPLGCEGAALQAKAVALAVATDPEKELNARAFIHELIHFLSPAGNVLGKKLEKVKMLLERSPEKKKIIDLLGNDSRIFASLPTAIYAFLSHYEDFEEALIFAVGLGGDTDTIGAMTGAISGGYHGRRGIPPRWLARLENREKGRNYIEKLAERLCQIKTSPAAS